MFSKRRSAAALLAAVLTLPAFGADISMWSNLEGLRQGDRIGVVRSDQTRIEGRFQGFTEAAVSLRADQILTLPRDNVVRVYRRPRTRRALRALIGGAIGVVAGAVLTNTAGDRFRNEGQDVPAGAWIAGAAGIGAGIGALSGGGYHTVYKRAR